MARILVVEDENFFSQGLERALYSLGHSSVRAPNGKAARQVLEREDFDLAIIDLKMPLVSGPELALWIRKNKPTPVLILAAFAELTEAKAAFGAEVAHLLIKPFNTEEVRLALELSLPQTYKGLQFPVPTPALMAIPNPSVRLGAASEFSLFHYIDGRPQKLLNRGDVLNRETLKLPSETPFFTDRETLSALLSSSFLPGHGVAANAKIDPAKRAEVMQNTLQVIVEQAAALGIDEKTLGSAVSLVTTYFRSIDDQAFWELLTSLDTYSKPIYAQTMAVTLISLLLAHELQYSAEERFKLTTAALFHDIGMTIINPELVKTPRVLLSVNDRVTVEKHVQIGAALVQKSGGMSAEISEIVFQHHESISGKGYPNGLKHQQIHPMARLIRVADDFCLSVMKSAGHPGIPPLKAIEALKASRDVDQAYVISLHRIIKTCEAVRA